MVSSKRKKKLPANPARGFATVSVPSKQKSAESPARSSAGDSIVLSESDLTTPAEGVQPPVDPQQAQSLQSYSPEELERHLEESELQLLVDKYALRCRNDAARQVSKLVTERRVLRQQCTTLNLIEWLPAEMLDSIFNLAKAEDSEINPISVRDSSGAKDSPSEEELCAKLWTLKETLLRLGFSNQRVDDLFKYLLQYHPGNFVGPSKEILWNLDESLDWFAMHCSEDELPPYAQANIPPAFNESDKAISWINEGESSQPSKPSTLQDDTAERRKGESGSPSPSSLDPYDSDSSLDPDTLIPKFVELQTRLYEIQPTLFDQRSKRWNNPRVATGPEDSRIAKIRQKIRSIEGDVLFERSEAESRWREKLDSLRKESVFMRQELDADGSHLEQTNCTASADQADSDRDNLSQIEDGEPSNLFGTMFEREEPTVQAGIVTEELNNAIISYRDFGKWTGLNPRRILEEACKSRDASYTVIYKDLSTSPHSNRKAVEVRWQKPQEIPYPLSLEKITHKSSAYVTFISMDNIVTATLQQAEAFISTLALFLLFPPGSKDGKLYLRLPAVWRSLWDEFSGARRLQENEADKKTVTNLKRLIKEDMYSFDDDVVLSHNFRKRNGPPRKHEPRTEGPRGAELGSGDRLKMIWAEKSSTPSFQHMTTGRKNLPIWGFKEEILTLLDAHRVLIICSETGSGKSTQVPSFILEHELQQGHHCKIYVTEPRRISAISLARRVSEELGEGKNRVGTPRSLIGFAVRLESQISQSSRLIFATTGVVVRMLERPEDFDDITHVVLDEVHERTIDSDFLLIVLRRLMQRRPSLKVILMSATLETQRFSAYLGGAPILDIPGRTFAVEAKYLEDIIELTGYQLANNEENIVTNEGDAGESMVEAVHGDTTAGVLATLDSYSKRTRDAVMNFDEYSLNYRLITRLLATIASAPSLIQFSKAILVFMPGMAEIRRLNDDILAEPMFQKGWIVHALHSSIASEDQERAFVLPPEGMRKIVIATNIAETGITIPDITAVIDAGKEKTMRFDERRQLSRLVESFISRANAKQRRGRAGRVRDGICFHLFTKYRHDRLLSEQQTPEILRLSLQDLVLRVKICKLGEVEQTLLEAVDAPSPKNIRRAIDSLKEVKALTSTEALTPLGVQLAKLPLDVFLGKLIIQGAFFKCLDAAVSIAAILSSKSPFINAIGSNAQRDLARLSFRRGDSDLLTVYNAYCAWKRVRNTPGSNEYTFCRKNFLSIQTLLSIEDIKMQLIVAATDAGMLQLDPEQKASLNRARARSATRNRSFFTIPSSSDTNSANDSVVNAVTAWSFYPKLLARDGRGWRGVANNQSVVLHPTSVNRASDPASIRWVSYYHLMQGKNRSYNALETSAVDGFAIALLCGDVDFKMYSGVVSIDTNRVRFAVRDWKSMLALKLLSLRVRGILAATLRDPGLTLSARQQEWTKIWQQIFDTATKRG